MNRLVIIGNGFDMAHGLKTSYKDFINWYWDRRVDAFVGNTSNVSEDCLCKLTIKDNPNLSCWNEFMYLNSYFKDIRGNKTYSGYEVITELQKYPDIFSVNTTPFFETILQSIETKGWVDIEYEYYILLKECFTPPQQISIFEPPKNLNKELEMLNNQFQYLKDIYTGKQLNKDLAC